MLDVNNFSFCFIWSWNVLVWYISVFYHCKSRKTSDVLQVEIKLTYIDKLPKPQTVPNIQLIGQNTPNITYFACQSAELIAHSNRNWPFAAWWVCLQPAGEDWRRLRPFPQGPAVCQRPRQVHIRTEHHKLAGVDFLHEEDHPDCLRHQCTPGEMEGTQWNWCCKNILCASYLMNIVFSFPYSYLDMKFISWVQDPKNMSLLEVYSVNRDVYLDFSVIFYLLYALTPTVNCFYLPLRLTYTAIPRASVKAWCMRRFRSSTLRSLLPGTRTSIPTGSSNSRLLISLRTQFITWMREPSDTPDIFNNNM